MNRDVALYKHLYKSSPWQLRLSERRILLVAGDLLVAYGSLVFALLYWFRSEPWKFKTFTDFLQARVPVWYFLLPLFWIVLLVELYDIHRAGDWKKTVQNVALAASIALGVYLLLYFSYVDSTTSGLPRRGVAGFLVSASILTLAWRRFYIRLFTAPQFMRRVLIVGGGRTGQILLKIIDDLSPAPFFIAGIIDDDPQKCNTTIEGHPVVGSSEDLLEIVAKQHISDIIVAISGELKGGMFQALLDSQELGVEITRMPVAYEELLGRVPIRLLEADWILRSFVDQARASGFYELGKRLIDVMGGLVGTLSLLIILPFISIATLIDSGRPIFYTQIRSGRGGQPYKFLKFRTMCQDAEADGVPQWASQNDQRATRVGRFLRRTHLDEFPQILNVLRGDMSLVGPRPERPELVEMFQRNVPFYRARLLVKPGITGWAQINYGYASTVDETIMKLEYDLYYIKHRSFLTDIVILLRTPSTMYGFRGR